jgi:hypothetical protein
VLETLARQWPADEQILHTFDCGGHSGGAAGTLRLQTETTRIRHTADSLLIKFS